MSTDKHTEAPPLDPHTLRVVIERLGERITHAETERENDASEGLPADEMADWDTRIEALELARWDIENIAKTANPRARVVVLPENIGGGVAVGGESYVHFIHGITGYSTGEVGVVGIRIAALGLLGRMPAAEAAAMGRSLIAAVEFAGGAN